MPCLPHYTRRFFQRIVLAAPVVFLAFATNSTAHAENAVFFSGEYFHWEEFGGDDKSLLTETGPRVGIGFTESWQSGSNYMTGEGTLYYGKILYDGQTQPPESIPIESTTRYVGSKLRLSVSQPFSSRRLGNQDYHSSLALAIGIEQWERSIYDTITYATTPPTLVYGYSEDYVILFTDAGLKTRSSNKYGTLEAGIGARMPFWTWEKIRELKLQLEPEPEASMYAHITFRPVSNPKLFIRASYEGYRFNASDSAQSPIDGRYYLQPESHADLFSINIGQYID